MIALVPSKVAILRQHRRAQDERKEALGSDWNDLDLVFDRADGRPASEWPVQQAFARAIRTSGVRRITFHQLRHANATLPGERLAPRVFQGRLGHATHAMTMRYSRVTANIARSAAHHVEALLIETNGENRDKLGATAPEDGQKPA